MENHWEDQIVRDTQKDLEEVVEILRRAVAREDSKLGVDGIGTRLALVVDELLQFS